MGHRKTPMSSRPSPRPRPAARLLGSGGHVHLDLAILVFLLGAAVTFVHAGVAKHSLAAVLFGTWGLALGFGFPAAMLLAYLLELARGRESDEAGGFVLLGGLVGALVGAAVAFRAHSAAPALAGFALGLAAGLVPAFYADRLPERLRGVGDMASEAVMLTAMAYVLIPFALFLYSALVLHFFEHGFSDGLKIASVLGAFTAAVLAFFWALSAFPVFAKLAVSAVFFGLLFGFAAFLTLLFFPTDGLAAWKVYAALGAEAAAAAAVCGWQFFRGLRDDA